MHINLSKRKKTISITKNITNKLHEYHHQYILKKFNLPLKKWVLILLHVLNMTFKGMHINLSN
jgi:hypothetical protein